MNKNDLQLLADLRMQEAEILRDNEKFDGAYYLAGYAVECGLKAIIAKKVKENDFPDKDLANKAYTHDLDKLVGTAGLKQDIEARSTADHAFERNWLIVKQWTEGDRYLHGRTSAETNALIDAIANPKNGILQWVRTHW